MAESIHPIKRLDTETALTCQRRAFVALITAIDVVRHQGVPVFEWKDDDTIKASQAEFDALIGPIGRGGLFNLIPARIEPTWSFYPPLTKPIRPHNLSFHIIAKYCAEKFPMISSDQWLRWGGMRDVPLDEMAVMCACSRCSAPDRVQMIDKWTDHCQFVHKYNPYILDVENRTPLWYVIHSFASGTSVDQVHTTLSAMERKRSIQPGVNPQYMLCAVLNYLREVGPISAREFDYKERVLNAPCHSNQSGGFSLFERGEQETSESFYKFVWEVSQKGAEWPSKCQCVDVLTRVWQHVNHNGGYDIDMWPQLICKLAVKAEMKGPKSSKMKCRVFFTVAYLKYLFDHLFLYDGMIRTYGKGGVAIGLKWKGGDAERIARKHHAYAGDWFHIEADAEKLDQSLLAAILIIVFSIPFLMQRFDKFVSPQWKEFMRQLGAFVVDGCAVKLIKWVGFQALWVIGIMFSGMLGTSWGDSTYMSLLSMCFDMFVYDNIKRDDPTLAALFKKTVFAKDIYGDDMLLSYPIIFWKYIIGTPIIENTIDLSVMSNYFLEAGGISIKSSEAFVYVGKDAFFSTVSKKGELIKAGPKFLQRRFIRVNVKISDVVTQCVVPWRVVTDYYGKVPYSFTDTSLDYYWIIKWRSLQFDTCGSNKEAYDFLDFMQRELLSIYAVDLVDVEADVALWISKIVDDTRDSDGARRLRKLGLRSEYFGLHLSQFDILKLFIWDENVQRQRCLLSALRHYDKDGSYEKMGQVYSDVGEIELELFDEN